tara:strand:- start:150 stop:533 length:384 start_codon:yes stop_codon:yes gene_type:complete
MKAMIIITSVLMLMAMEKIAFAESEHYAGPGWIGYNCDNIVDPDQAVVCNTIVQEQLVIKENGWEVWEFDDSYILLHERKEIFTWDCIVDDDTDKANLFFCEAIMGYDYDKIYESFDSRSNSNNNAS